MKKMILAAVALLPGVVAAQHRTVWDGVYTEAQAERGARVYDQSCAWCHGSDLAGRLWVEGQGYVAPVPPRPRASGLERRAPPLAGPDFVADWNGLPLEALFTRNLISMPQNAPGSLSRQQNADVLAFLLQKNGFPAGTTELPPNAIPLKEIAFVAAKP